MDELPYLGQIIQRGRLETADRQRWLPGRGKTPFPICICTGNSQCRIWAFIINYCLSRMQKLGVLLFLILVYGQSCSQPGQQYPTLGQIVRENPLLDQLIPADAKVEVLASGFAWTEGPVWVK